MGKNGLVETIRLRITPTANRNSYRVARFVGVLTQGSVLRPQPWAGESQLRQSCRCLCGAVYGYSPCCCCLWGGCLRVLPILLLLAGFLPTISPTLLLLAGDCLRVLPILLLLAGFLPTITPHIAAACGLPANNNSHDAVACVFMPTIISHIAAACEVLSIISPHAAATCEGMPLYHCTIFTMNTWMGGEIGTAIIIIMIYYKKTAHHFVRIEIMAIFAHHHLYLCHNH